jgi:hypothetical protein
MLLSILVAIVWLNRIPAQVLAISIFASNLADWALNFNFFFGDAQ